MGVTAVSISPMLAMAAMPGVGLTGIYGAVLVGGIFGLCVSPFVKYVLRFFPSVVTGTIITMIGVVLMRVGVNWAGGGAGQGGLRRGRLSRRRRASCSRIILLIIKFGRGFMQNVAVLIGIARRLSRDHRARLDRISPAFGTSRLCASSCRCSSACRNSI